MIIHGDSLFELQKLESNSVDAVVTDPPYGLAFMNKKWDYDVPSVELWREVFRVLKPGGHVLSFGGTRTYHRMVVNIEDAGFEIRDQIQWIYGSGFPKSHNIKDGDFKGWGTALKPANEPICLARKPLENGLTVADNILKYGTGALNIDGSRIDLNGEKISNSTSQPYASETTWSVSKTPGIIRPQPQGRWPANILFDEAAAQMLDAQSGDRGISKGGSRGGNRNQNFGMAAQDIPLGFGDSGGASRFFYVAKASKRERNAGLDGMPQVLRTDADGLKMPDPRMKKPQQRVGNENHHPTVKPIKLMEYLCRLITPPGGVILDPFMGSGSTGVAAKNLNFKFIGIEREKEYCAIAEKRINQNGEI